MESDDRSKVERQAEDVARAEERLRAEMEASERLHHLANGVREALDRYKELDVTVDWPPPLPPSPPPALDTTLADQVERGTAGAPESQDRLAHRRARDRARDELQEREVDLLEELVRRAGRADARSQAAANRERIIVILAGVTFLAVALTLLFA